MTLNNGVDPAKRGAFLAPSTGKFIKAMRDQQNVKLTDG